MNYNQRITSLLEDLNLFNGGTSRYEHMINLGKNLPPLPDQYPNNENLIVGCQSRVWVGVSISVDNTLIIL